MWSVVGHDGAVRALSRSLEQGRASHAHLFLGPKGVGKMHLALNFAQALNCTADAKPCGVCAQCRRIMAGKHADIHVVALPTTSDGPARKTIPIEAIKDMQAAAGLEPFEGTVRVVIIDGADCLSPAASSRLLKTLEEPPGAVVLVLLAESDGDILETVLSRCQTLRLRPVPRQVIEEHLAAHLEAEPARAKLLAALAAGSIGWAIRAAQDEGVLEERQSIIEEAAALAYRPYYERFESARTMSEGFSRKRDHVYLWLALVGQLWRDLLLVKGGQAQSMVHADRLEELNELATRLSFEEIASGLRLCAETAEHLGRNANPRLALDVLMLGLPVVTMSSSV